MVYPSSFIVANKFTAKWEKGYVNHPNDPGGATYNGVSLRFLQDRKLDIDGDGLVTIKDIQTLFANKDQARVDQIFYQAFWKEANLDALNCIPLQVAVYDCNVNAGRSRSAKCLQRAVNITAGRDLLKADGIIGNQTMGAVSDLLQKGYCDALAQATVDQRISFHKNLANSSPYPDGRDYRPFIKGWLNRCSDLKAYIDQI